MNYGRVARLGTAERDMTNNWGAPSAAEAALGDMHRATDNAIRTMFELAQRLELLREAIERANSEAPWQLRELRWSAAGRVSAGAIVEP